MENKNAALAKLNSIISSGQEKAAQGMAALEREYQIRRDYIVKPEVIDAEFIPLPKGTPGMELRVIAGGESYGLTDFSRNQLLDRAGIPPAFARNLEKWEAYDVLTDNIRRLVPVVSSEGVMIREVGGTAKGILSPSYKRLDASPLFEAYITASLKGGFVPHKGMVTETRAFLSFIQQEVIEILPGEYVVIGHELRTSDYGRGALQFALNLNRLLCLNGLTAQDILRKVHLGRRFDASEYEGSVIELSKQTMELDTATVRSALNDVFASVPHHIAQLQARIQDSTLKALNLQGALAALQKRFPKTLVEEAKSLYQNPGLPVEAVPAEPGRWRFAQVLSLLAHKQNPDVATDLQDYAFEQLVA